MCKYILLPAVVDEIKMKAAVADPRERTPREDASDQALFRSTKMAGWLQVKGRCWPTRPQNL